MTQVTEISGCAVEMQDPRSRSDQGQSDRDRLHLPTVWSSVEWVAYFRTNAQRRLDIPWASGSGATPEELEPIVGSLRGWQLGETSEGTHLLKAARSYVSKVGDPEFLDVVRLFIAEEQRHGNLLGRFLDLAGVTHAKWDWGDALFRAARYLVPRMEVWATPVAMVETHALLYFGAIRRTNRSAVLRQICRQILADEVPHIRFQCERLAVLHRHRSRVLWVATMAIHRVLFVAITVAIWTGHRRALRAGGYTFPRFWSAAWATMSRAWRMMDPRAYRWAAGSRS